MCPTKKNDATNPDHYMGDGNIECRMAMRSMLAGYQRSGGKFSNEVVYWILCAFKYIWRAPLKNGLEDIKKAKQCLEFALEGKEAV